MHSRTPEYGCHVRSLRARRHDKGGLAWHPRCHALSRDGLQPHFVNTRVLLRKWNYGASRCVDTYIAIGRAPVAEVGIALAAHLHVEVARRARPGVEMLAEAHPGCGRHDAMTPGGADIILRPLLPGHHIAF